MKEINYCPTCDVSCPYCIGLDYECVIDNPLEECDDYYACVGEDEDKDDDFDWGAMNYDALDCDEDWYAEDTE